MSDQEYTSATSTSEVCSSTGDVYSTPIALGFEALTSEDPIPTTVYGPENYPNEDASTSTTTLPYNKDIKDGCAIRGRCGLYNLGNTCFMNSGLQCLMSTLPIVRFLLRYHDNRKGMENTLLGQFQTLFMKMWSGKFTVVHPKTFKMTLGIYHSQFQDYRQHDCQEFLALLLDSLHEQLNFKHRQSTNQNSEAGPSCSKQPITFEHNINNKLSANKRLGETENDSAQTDKSRNAVSTHSSLTFDNMKDSKTEMMPNSSRGDVLESKEQTSSSTCRNAQNLIPFTVNPISEDSCHSNVSEHSSDSEQCSVMKNLKLRSSPVVSQSTEVLSMKIMNDCGTKCGVSSTDVATFDYDEDIDAIGSDGVKRVNSLQDFNAGRQGEKRLLMKASSENDLIMKASANCDNNGDFMDSLVDPHLNGNCAAGGRANNSSQYDGTDTSECTEPVLLNNAKSATAVPSLEDIYSKETKTLNTNVLATEFIVDSVTTDSDKFAKHDNTCDREEEMDEEDIIQNVMEVAGSKNDSSFEAKRIKDVNIQAQKKVRSPKGACGSGSAMNMEKEDCFTLNSVKRMKFEGTEKNLQMQEICKINKEVLLCQAMQGSKASTSEQGVFRKDASPALESDVDSDMVEDIEMDVSDDNEAQEAVAAMCSGRAESVPYTASEVVAAEHAWHKYLSKNDSIIVDTFQGQFKSTVVCAECQQVSVTFEPFMYLSVPVPRAMERQLCIVFVCAGSVPTQYLLTMHKQDKIAKVKRELCNLIGRQSGDIIIAEVLNWHISRILEDNTMLRYINDSSRKLYAFEVDQSCVGDITDGEITSSSNATATPIASRDSMIPQLDVFSDVGTFSVSSSMTLNQNISESGSYYDTQDSQNLVTNSDDLDIIGTGMWEWGQAPSSTEKRRGSLETNPDENWLSADSTTAGSSTLNFAEDIAKAISNQGIEVEVKNDYDKAAVSSSNGAEGSSDWKSCAICLEELPETELMVHTTCGGTFCSACLEMSVQHYSESGYCCPVCSTPADITEDFVPLTNASNHKPKTRIIAVPIAYRCEHDPAGNMDGPYLFAHPTMINLPSNLSGQHITTCIQRLQPDIGEFRVLLTDGTGVRCSRCLYMEHCTGCEIPQDGEAVLRPGDHLAVTVNTTTPAQVEQGQRLECHRSMENQQSSEPLTLMDCFRAFTQSEELDEHNPWFCPHCKQNQQAKKTMTVWQYPDTLIIQLKRFVFHELSSTKVDNKVIFPVDSLDLNHFISGPSTKNLHYNLNSLVCHFGGANSGHYTSYAKHPIDGKWYYYNDETVSERTPGEEEFSSTYVLFYQRRGTEQALHIPDDLELYVEPEFTGEQATSSPLPCLVYSPIEGEITLTVKNGQVTVSDEPSPSTSSSNPVLPSTGSCDLYVVKGTEEASQSGVRAELAEADSTGEGYEFYT